jgi:two-component system, NarL family, nitrate/nitrite response regulator NarL
MNHLAAKEGSRTCNDRTVAAPGTYMSARRKVRVFVVSDVRLYRECLSRLIATEDALNLAGAARIAESPSRVRAGAHPDVVIVDAIQCLDLTVAREIASAAGEARVVALVAPDLEDDLLGLAGAGVSGFLSWEASSRQLVEIVEHAARGERPCSADVADAILRQAGERSGGDLSFDGSLTKREAQIADLVADGLSNKAIASHLSIELATVKNHVHRVLEKLEVHSRGEAAAKLTNRAGPKGLRKS